MLLVPSLQPQSQDPASSHPLPSHGGDLQFEYYVTRSETLTNATDSPSGLRVITASNLPSNPKEVSQICGELIKAHSIPELHHMRLHACVRRCKAFGSQSTRQAATMQRLLAFAILTYTVGSGPLNEVDPVATLLQHEPDFIRDVVQVVSTPAMPTVLRLAAFRALSALLCDRGKLATVLTQTGSGAHHGMFLFSLIGAVIGAKEGL